MAIAVTIRETRLDIHERSRVVFTSNSFVRYPLQAVFASLVPGPATVDRIAGTLATGASVPN
jgi:hypothetical protein